MSIFLIAGISVVYILLLFLIAYLTEKQTDRKHRVVNNPYVYSLSLAVYCTAWTYYGSVGRAAEMGLGFLPIHLGPTILAPLFFLLLRKIILISKAQRITSLADFVSARYGKSTTLGAIVTLVLVLGIVPYISLQLKAIAFSIQILTKNPETPASVDTPFFADAALFIATALTFFTIIFGVRKLDANERHEGLVAAIAFESIVKLVAFLGVGIFVTFQVFDGFGDLFQQAARNPELQSLFTLQGVGLDGWSWMWLTIISMCAVLLLPRQFHMAVVENANPEFTQKASWLFPLYLFLINLFVFPIAIGGDMIFAGNPLIEADTYVLNIPLSFGSEWLALFVFLGGLSAASGMVIVSVISLSIMVSNNMILPVLLKTGRQDEGVYFNFFERFLGIRRLSVVIILFLAYGFYKILGVDYPLVSIGLISFTAVAQLAPAVIGGLYWKEITRKGILAGLLCGFIIWGYTLPLPALLESSDLPFSFIKEGLFGFSWLKPYSFFGDLGMSPVAHASFWSLFINILVTVVVSLYSRQDVEEIAQANFFVDFFKNSQDPTEYRSVPRKAKTTDIIDLLERILGVERAHELIQDFEKNIGHSSITEQEEANVQFINYAETQLAGSIGAASARIVSSSIIRQEPITLKEMIRMIEETKEIIDYSKEVELKSKELEKTANQLMAANDRLKELDQLKAEFINTVTHELRTPITSIKAFSKILLDNPELDEEKKDSFLRIVVSECERISRLINQVLDIRKLEKNTTDLHLQTLDLCEVAAHAYNGLHQLFEEKKITYSLSLPSTPVFIKGDRDRLIQVFINLLSNAIKFCDAEQGEVAIEVRRSHTLAVVEIWDNGIGIPVKDQKYVFEQFTQVLHKDRGKPQGSGLGLYISKVLIEMQKGSIRLESQKGSGTKFFVSFPLI